jgi:hypothetical protein
MDFLFFVIYNMYYRDGNYTNDRPAFTVYCQFVVSITGFIFGLLYLMSWLIKGSCYKFFISMPIIFLTLPVSFIVTYFLFYRKKRYEKIYFKYKDNSFFRSLFAKVFAVLMMFTTALFGIIVIYLKNKYDLCPIEENVPFSISFPK